MNNRIEKLVRPTILNLKPYSSARSLKAFDDSTVYLDANESPTPSKVAGLESLNRYPDPQPQKLVSALAQFYETEPNKVLVGRGVDDILDVLIRTFCECGRDEVLICPPTYGAYRVFAEIQGINVQEVPLNRDYQIEADSINYKCRSTTKLVFVCTPNNPTGNLINSEDILKVAKSLIGRSLIVVDEAYIEFSKATSLSKMIDELPNLVVLRTMSKAFALAGARIGVAIAAPNVIEVMKKVIAPYPVSAPSADAALKALSNQGIEESKLRCTLIVEEKEKFTEGLKKIPFVKSIYPSDANFLLLEVDPLGEVLKACERAKIVVRDRSSVVPNTIRVTVGTAEENSKLVETLGAIEL